MEAIGQTRFDHSLHVLCAGTEDEVLRILISIYGWRPSRPHGIAGMLMRERV